MVCVAYDVDVKTIRKGKAELANLLTTHIRRIHKVLEGFTKTTTLLAIT